MEEEKEKEKRNCHFFLISLREKEKKIAFSNVADVPR
jgi:hypothetical protein